MILATFEKPSCSPSPILITECYIFEVTLLFTVLVIIGRHAKWINAGKATAQLNAALFASHILETILLALPHPSHRMLYTQERKILENVYFK